MPPPDKNFAGWDAPASGIISITPIDGGSNAVGTRGIRVASGGNLSVKMIDGSVAVIQNVMSGETLFLRLQNIEYSGTTASGIVGYL